MVISGQHKFELGASNEAAVAKTRTHLMKAKTPTSLRGRGEDAKWRANNNDIAVYRTNTAQRTLESNKHIEP